MEKITKITKKRPFIIRSMGLLIFSICSLIPLALILCALSPIIPPNISCIPAIVSLLFPYLLISSFIIGFAYLFFKKLRCIIFFIAILINYSNISNFVIFPNNEDNTITNTAKQVNIISFNVNLLDYYININKTRGVTKNEIVNFICNSKADIICLQEYYESKNSNFRVRDKLEKYGYKYISKVESNKNFYYANVIFSKHPIIASNNMDFISPLNVIYADIKINKDTIRVYNLHLESNKFDKTDYTFYQNLTENRTNTNDYTKNTKRILKKYTNACKSRSQQVDLFLKELEQDKERENIIICGDLNETPNSYIYNKLCKSFVDSFAEKGSGAGSTYRGKFPAHRIDYILHSDSIKTIKSEVLDVNFSDHLPLKVTLELK